MGVLKEDPDAAEKEEPEALGEQTNNHRVADNSYKEQDTHHKAFIDTTLRG